jgi:phosphoribosylformylglycinamidine synthase
VIRDAVYDPPAQQTLELPQSADAQQQQETVLSILSSLNVASKHWVIRQYDHEVQGGSVVKPLVGPMCDGPSDAAVVKPLLTSKRGLVISCGMNPHYGDFDTYHMAASAIDEAMRNAVAVGADPSKIAILDNFCWGYTDRPETLGSLVRAAIACQDMAIALGTPFISGKDSLNNEFSYMDADDEKQTISIPPSLLISAMGQIEDVAKAVTMDAKEAGNAVILIGKTKDELGGSHYCLVNDQQGGQVPTVDTDLAKATFAAVHECISAGLIRSCHDLSEGGLAIAATEMAMAGGLGISLDLQAAEPTADGELGDLTLLFSESNSRFLAEVQPEAVESVLQIFQQKGVPAAQVGTIAAERQVQVHRGQRELLNLSTDAAKAAWQKPLDW